MTEAFVDAALNLAAADYGESFNIGTGPQDHDRRGRRRRPASCSGSPPSPSFTMPERSWDVPGLVRQHRQGPGPARLGAADRLPRRPAGRPPTWYRDLPDKAQIPPVVEEVRPGHRLQRQRHHRLLQGQPGDPDHVRAAQGDVHQAEHRLRDHLRQRLQPRRHRGGHPRHLAQRPAGASASPTRGTSARSRRSGAAWRSPRRTPASCSTATSRTRPS